MSAVFGSNEEDADCTCVRYILKNTPIVENLVWKTIRYPLLCVPIIGWLVRLTFPFLFSPASIIVIIIFSPGLAA